MKNNLPNKLRILFISRAYPPTVGGIENQNYELARHLAQITPTTIIANKHGKKFLPIFLPYTLLYALINMRKYDALVLGDGVLGIVGWAVKKLYNTRKTVACIVHGLDLTFKNNFYQKWWVRKFIPSCDKLFAVGNQTIIEGVARGIAQNKFTFIPNGVDIETFKPQPANPARLAQIVNDSKSANSKSAQFDIADKKILYTGGRLARRKGVAWFITNVMPLLPENVVYIVSGAGPYRDNIISSIAQNNLQNRVILLGYISDETRHTILNTADIFIQPNIPVDGDMEGFGLVVLEAAASEIPVVVAKLEGLKDAIHENKNGFLVESQNAEAWRDKIAQILDDDFDRKSFTQNARTYTITHFSWDKIAQEYYDNLQK